MKKFWMFIVMTAAALVVVASAQAQSITVAGIVSDKSGPLAGVTVLLAGTTRGTATDIQGQYSIDINVPNAVLIFSYIGYEPQTAWVGDRRVINVTMVEDSETLEEVVAVPAPTDQKE